MPWRFVVQPSGKLARFSTIVDNFTHYDLTEDEALGMARKDMGEWDAAEKVARAQREEIPDRPGTSGPPLYRYREAMETVRLIHGLREAAKVEKLLGPLPPAPLSGGRGGEEV